MTLVAEKGEKKLSKSAVKSAIQSELKRGALYAGVLELRTISDSSDRQADWGKGFFSLRPGQLVQLDMSDLSTVVHAVSLDGAECHQLPKESTGRAYCFELSTGSFQHFFQFAASGSSDLSSWHRYLVAQIGLLSVNSKIEAVEAMIIDCEVQATELMLARDFDPVS